MRRYLTDLSAEYVRSIFTLDVERGILRWAYRADRPKSWNTRFCGRLAGSHFRDGSRQVEIDRRRYAVHRIIWLHRFGVWPPADIDHKDGTAAGDGAKNLRTATPSENGRNRGANRNNTTGFKGVSLYKRTGRYTAQIHLHGRKNHLGCFDTPEAAAAAYRDAARRLHGDFAKTH